MGGVAIFTVFSVFVMLQYKIITDRNKILVIIIAGFFVFLIGIIDDIFNLRSYHKIFLQIIIVLIIINFGVKATLFGKPWGNIITLLWIIGITNAFNLIDNMDGLSSGIAIVASLFLGFHFSSVGESSFAGISILFGAVMAGFFIFNFFRSQIFLGDSGALFAGFFLSAITILGSQKSGESLFASIIFPISIMLVPIFDTIVVSITRRIRGLSPFRGGRDHISHRLVIMGFSEKKAVLFLISISIFMGGTTYLVRELNVLISIAVYFVTTLFLILFCFYLSRINISLSGQKNDFIKLRNLNFQYKKNIFLLLTDMILFCFTYYFSFIIKYEGILSKQTMQIFEQSLPIIVIAKLLLLILLGVYSLEIQFSSFLFGIRIIGALSLGTMFVIGALYLFSNSKFVPAGIFIIDWMLSLIMLLGVKFSFRIFDELFFKVKTKKFDRAVFFGSKENYHALKKYLDHKSRISICIYRFFDSNEQNISTMFKYINNREKNISMLLLDDNNSIKSMEVKNLNKREIPILNEREFFRKILN